MLTQVTQHLDGAFKDEKGRDRKPKEVKRATVDEVATAKINSGLSGEASDHKGEMLKAYKEAEHYRREAKKLRSQLDQFSNSYEEISKLKNLVAEKMQVIGLLQKERTSMSKLHREYQKDRMDQDSMESEYSSRVQRVNGAPPTPP
ncbi:hypothetical protein T484DRAFT_2545905 [Baffinella frigidus]|nr:hypothetical protein T484DRAFT_2545905 [Cryptophyta sp. CCMP2293]